MRLPPVSLGQTADCLRECVWQTACCVVGACGTLATVHHLLSQPYPALDVVIAAPTYARRLNFKIVNDVKWFALTNRPVEG
ncbi:hypothetical protein KGM_209482 [Danaus plexippus plexippus]|uniref:Uncharacterized protein n=1 Tax=Danaus plexippus plexippus TaxID=278856 RepID=A0A212FLH0_DANPL|nr:hypothetical protein KGM_209482 [Danaus plexippus plexippus]